MDITQYNRNAWNRYVEKKDRWTIPVTDEVVEAARSGKWQVLLTPSKPVPHEWFPPLNGLRVLGLASGGGQQGPILAAAGAEVTIFDNSELQLKQDQMVSEKHGLNIKTVRGDMIDLSVFADSGFDLIFNPCSILFVRELQKVWNECSRVLKPGGILMTGLMQSLAFQTEVIDGKPVIIYPRPYSDLESLPKDKLDAFIRDDEALLFGHSLEEQLGGPLKAGFTLTHMFEDDWAGENSLDPYFPSFVSARFLKIQNI